MTKLKIIYLSNPQGEYAVLNEDKNKAIDAGHSNRDNRFHTVYFACQYGMPWTATTV